MTRFENQFQDHKENPFLFRVVFINYEGVAGSPLQIFFQKLFDIFSTRGQHIWYFHLSVTVWKDGKQELDFSEYYSKVTELLVCLPNLKVFQILQPCRFPDGGEIGMSATEENQVRKYFQDCPVPFLKDLKCFFAPNNSQCFFKHFVSSNPQVAVLHGGYHYQVSVGDVYTGPLTQTHDLNLTFYQNQHFMSLMTCKDFWGAENLTFDLRELDLDLDIVINILNTKVSEGLQKLVLYLPRKTSISQATKRLDFHCLMELFVSMNDYVSLDFIMSLRDNLVTLRIVVDTFPEYSKFLEAAIRSKSRIKLFEYRGMLLKSNIWVEYPKLQKLQYITASSSEHKKEVTFTRNDWHVYIESGCQ